MKEELECVLHAMDYPLVYADKNHVIKFLNKSAEDFYYKQKRYGNLIGKSLLDCHNETSREAIIKAVESFSNHGGEIFFKVNSKNQRLYITPVHNDKGEFIGYFERQEDNAAK